MKKSADFAACVTQAREKFNEYYDHSIRDLLSIFPKDHKDKEGSPFWSGPKRCPSPVVFSADESIHMEFVLAYANLIAANLNIPQRPKNKDGSLPKDVIDMARNAKVGNYVPKKIEVKTPEEEKEQANNNQPAQPEVVAPEDEKMIEQTLANLG